MKNSTGQGFQIDREQAERFETDGFLVLPDALAPDDIAQLRAAIGETVAGFDPVSHGSVFSTRDRDAGRDERFFRSSETVEYFLEEDALDEDGELRRPLAQSINKLGHALHDHVPALTAFCRRPDLAAAYRALGLTRPQLWQTMVIFKQPGIGGEVRWHQDASYLYSTPASVIGLWIALEDADRNNGCLMVAPGGHRGPLRERYRVDWSDRSGELETLHEASWPAAGATRALEVPAGSAVFFNDHLPHGSTANRSDRSRTALTLHAADSGSAWSAHNWLQRRTLPPFLL